MIAVSHHRSAPGAAPVPPRGEAGVAGGFEALPFGVLIFVVGSLMITNAWAVVDAKLATTSAAREAARSFVEADSYSQGAARGRTAAQDAISSYGRNPSKLSLPPPTLDPDYRRCARVTYTASYPVPALSLPFGVGFGSGFTVKARHSEIVDPFRGGLPVENACGF